VRRTAVIAALVAALAAMLVPASAGALPRGTHVQLFVGGLNFPVDIAYVPNSHTLFFTEKNTGNIWVVVNHTLLPQACVRLPVLNDGERGALGLVVDPHFRTNHYLYVYFTNRSPVENRVVRFTVTANRCVSPKVIIRGIPSVSGYHNGGQLLFVGTKLFVTVGEGHTAGNAQYLGTRLGKILRYNPNGTIPSDNPVFLGRRSAIWSYGHRNGFGLALRGYTGQVFETENGPNCDDEVNRILRAHNYGWGDGYRCGTNGVGPRPTAPLERWTPTIAPTDPWYYTGRVRQLRDALIMGDFNTGTLRRIVLNRKGTGVVSTSSIYRIDGGILDVSSGPGAWLYFATPTAIYRIVS
jgi:glucose/arabinose dehydrogenase